MENDIGQCSIFLAYRGNMNFDDTKPMMQAEYKASAEAIGRVQAQVDEAKLRGEHTMKLRTRKPKKRPHISSDEDDDIDLEQLLEDPGYAKKAKLENNMQKPKMKECSITLNHIDDSIRHGLKQIQPENGVDVQLEIVDVNKDENNNQNTGRDSVNLDVPKR